MRNKLGTTIRGILIYKKLDSKVLGPIPGIMYNISYMLPNTLIWLRLINHDIITQETARKTCETESRVSPRTESNNSGEWSAAMNMLEIIAFNQSQYYIERTSPT